MRATSPRPPLRVLFIDDDGAMRELAVDGLPAWGFEVTTFASAEEAFAAEAAFSAADVVATDVHLPGASGFDVASFVRTNYPRLPVLVLSADAHVSTRAGALALPFLAKPVALEVLAATLDRLARTVTT